MDLHTIQRLAQPGKSKIILLVLDGLGGVPPEPGGMTELERAETPNLDGLASAGICGLHEPVGPGITPGSGAGHLALFGYDPLEYEVGRGVLSALGTDFDLTARDVAARGNFCSLDENGLVTDRRAGRISTEKNRALCQLLRKIDLPGAELFVETVKEHRFLLVLRGDELSGDIEDTDPQRAGKEPLPPQARTDAARHTAQLVEQFLSQAREQLAEHHPANMILLRGFAKFPDWPTFQDAFGLRAAAIADYPMYRGVAKLLGMKALSTEAALEEKISVARKHWDRFDFFFIHVKPTDSSGEDGDFDRKVAEIEKADQALPGLLELGPDVVIVTGDHSTPAVLASHSWHPVPLLMWAKHCRSDMVERFGERACLTGALGPRLPASQIMPIALANALRMEKFGA